jgi:hypothetical protein
MSEFQAKYNIMKRTFANVLQEAKDKGAKVTIWYVAGTGLDYSNTMEVAEVGKDFFSSTEGVYIPFTAIARLYVM